MIETLSESKLHTISSPPSGFKARLTGVLPTSRSAINLSFLRSTEATCDDPEHADSRDNSVVFRIDYADVGRARVHNVDFIPLRIRGNSGRLGSHAQSAHEPEGAQIDH